MRIKKEIIPEKTHITYECDICKNWYYYEGDAYSCEEKCIKKQECEHELKYIMESNYNDYNLIYPTKECIKCSYSEEIEISLNEIPEDITKKIFEIRMKSLESENIDEKLLNKKENKNERN